MTLRLHRIDDFSALERLAPAWSALLLRSSSDEPVLTPTWLLQWWRIFGGLDGRTLRVACFYRGTELVGLAPLVVRRIWYRAGIPFIRLEPLGSGEERQDEICSDYLNVIAERGSERQVAFALVDALLSGRLGDWDEWIMPAMDGSGPIPQLLCGAFGDRGVSVEVTPESSACYIPLPPTWDEYLAQLSSSDRYLVKRSIRDFEKWAGRIELECAGSFAQLEDGKKILFTLHDERWAGAGHGGAFGSTRFRAFHDAVMRELMLQGALDLLWIRARGEPVAALYNIVHARKVHFYQSGRKVDVPKGIRPGIVIHAAAIRRAIDLGLREYDFLGGGSQYKKQLGLAARPVVCLRAARPTIRERARCLADGGIALARRARGLEAKSRPLRWIATRFASFL